MLDQAGGTSNVLQGVHRTSINFGAPSAPSATVVDVDSSGVTGLKVMTVDFAAGGALSASPSEDFYIVLTCQNVGDKVIALDISWTDPGSRNH